MGEFGGKEKRVMGTFVLMVGAGIVLESPIWWAGAVLMVLGAAALVWGGIETRPRAPQPDATAPPVGVRSAATLAGREAENPR